MANRMHPGCKAKVLACMVVALLVGPGRAQNTGAPQAVRAEVTLTFAHGASEDNPRHIAALAFAEGVAKASKGRIAVAVSPASRSGDDSAVLHKVAAGDIAITANSQGAVSRIVPEFAALGMPYLFRSEYEVWRLMSGRVGEALDQKARAQGLVVLGMWDNGFRQITNSKRPIRTPEDLRGLVIRTPPDPVTEDLVRTLGATPKVVPFGELPAALREGRVDGQENPLINIYTAQIHKVQKYLSLTNHKYESTPLLMSRLVWDRLSPTDRNVVRQAALDATLLQRELMVKSDERTFARLAQSEIRTNSVYDFAPFERATAPMVDRWRAGPIGAFVDEVFAAVREERSRAAAKPARATVKP